MTRMLAATLGVFTMVAAASAVHAASLDGSRLPSGAVAHDPAPQARELRLAAGGKAAGDACAAKLPAESRLIYDATVRNLGSAASIRDVVTEQTRALVMQGNVQMSTAKTSAEATAPCLELVAKG